LALDDTTLKRYRRWFLEIEGKYKDLNYFLGIAGQKDFARQHRPFTAFFNLEEILVAVSGKKMKFDDIDINKDRFFAVRRKVLLVIMRADYEALRDHPTSFLQQNKVLTDICLRFRMTYRHYVEICGVDPAEAKINPGNYYRVLVRANKVFWHQAEQKSSSAL
jgi:hypothetical protein